MNFRLQPILFRNQTGQHFMYENCRRRNLKLTLNRRRAVLTFASRSCELMRRQNHDCRLTSLPKEYSFSGPKRFFSAYSCQRRATMRKLAITGIER